tara:strand:- start:7508 stop:9343 length:1836 start_codon:yes stop_codon:yes gene_type:complete
MPTNDTTNKFLDFNLPQDAYVAFDAVTLKEYIINRLNENEKFTDQNFDGSNLAAIIDIIAYSYHVLLFYLNTTASEVNFDQATLYENMNKIVKLIGYKPVGKQTSIVPINAVGSSTMPTGNYTIRKYSYFLANGIQYTFNKDFSFNKNISNNETIQTLNDTVVLYQGSIKEYPDYKAQGEDFETLPVVVKNIVDTNTEKFIAEDTISVYVKEIDTNTYYEYSEVDSLYLTKSVDRVYELRLNEDGFYEVKFGNGVFGKTLKEGDTVSVNYLQSDNVGGIISKNTINGDKLFVYDSPRQRAIFNDTYPNKDETTFIDITNSSYLNINNPQASTSLSDAETVDQIRQNAPKVFSSQLRLVTEEDYESFINKNLANVVNSVDVVDNNSYLNGYIKYFYDMCVDPNKVNRVIVNQINFADACDFNNINVFVVPKFTPIQDESYPPFLSNSFKNLLIEQTNERKILSNTVVPRDPIYMAFGLGMSNSSTLNLDILNNTCLYAVREANNKINKETIKSRIASKIKAFFAPENNKLGQNLSLNELMRDLLAIEGVRNIYTKNEKDGSSIETISFLSFNPLYEQSDISLVNQNLTLPYFKFPYLYSPLSVAKRIKVIDE